MEKITVPFEIKEFSSDDKYYTFKGHASTFGNVDLGEDRVTKVAFDEFLQEIKGTGAIVPLLWQHNHGEPIGVLPTLGTDSKGLLVEGRMPKNDSFVSGRVVPQIEIGSIGKMSIGYGIKKNGSEYKDGVRELNNLHLYEVSLVTFPMNPEASITAFKSVDFSGLDYEDARTLERALKDGIKFQAADAKKIISLMKSAGMLRDGQDGNRDGDEKAIEQALDNFINAFKGV